MTWDVAELRAHFPSLASGIAHFDGPGGTQTPRQVGEAIAATLTGPLSQRGSALISARNADDAVTGFRDAMADLLGSPAAGIVFGRSATQLTYDLARTLAEDFAPDDVVVVSSLDHDANIRPWIQAAEAVGARVRWLEFDPVTAGIPLEAVDQALDPADGRVRLLAVTGASNLLGSRPELPRIAERVHAAGALLHVDAVHLAPHALIDRIALGADTLVCSAYKFLGPHCGILAADPALLEQLRPDKLVPASDAVPDRFEHGTLPFEILAGVSAAVDFLAALGRDRSQAADGRRAELACAYRLLDDHETRLLTRLEDGLSGFGDAVVNHSTAGHRTPTVLISLPGRRTRDAAAYLATRDVQAPAGSFYAVEPFRRLGVDDDGGLRIGLAPYTTEDEIDRLLTGLADHLAR